jgi:4-hydroxy-tetrahydrodipicolinate synthase
MTLGSAAVVARVPRFRAASVGAKVMRGVFIILNTPFASDGAVDWDDLAHEVEFVDRGGCQGVVWPQGSSGVATLTRDERVRGMEVLVKAVQGGQLTLVLGVQGRDTAEMLEYAKRAETLGTDAMIDASHDSHVPKGLPCVFPRAGRRHSATDNCADERWRRRHRAEH